MKISNVQPGLVERTIVCPHLKFRIQIFPISISREPGISDPNPYQGWGEKGPERWREGGIWRRHEGRVVTVARGGCGNGSPDTAQWLATLHRRNRMSHLGQERSCDRTERGIFSAEAIPLCPCRLRDCSFIVVLTVQVAQPFIDVCFCFVVSLSFPLLYNPVELRSI